MADNQEMESNQENLSQCISENINVENVEVSDILRDLSPDPLEAANVIPDTLKEYLKKVDEVKINNLEDIFLKSDSATAPTTISPEQLEDTAFIRDMADLLYTNMAKAARDYISRWAKAREYIVRGYCAKQEKQHKFTSFKPKLYYIKLVKDGPVEEEPKIIAEHEYTSDEAAIQGARTIGWFNSDDFKKAWKSIPTPVMGIIQQEQNKYLGRIRMIRKAQEHVKQLQRITYGTYTQRQKWLKEAIETLEAYMGPF